jgi:hypothetical protein
MKSKVVDATGGEVTGSAYSVQTERAKVLADAGMFQGGKKSEARNRPPVNLSKLDKAATEALEGPTIIEPKPELEGNRTHENRHAGRERPSHSAWHFP